MKAILSGKVELLSVEVIAEVAIWTRRPELQRMCRAMQEDALYDELLEAELPGLSRAALENLSRHLEYLELIDHDARLTSRGRRCAETGEAPSFEYGGYQFLVARHPSFGVAILDFLRASAQSRDGNFDNLPPLPDWLRADPARVWRSPAPNGPTFSVCRFPAAQNGRAKGRVERIPSVDLTCEIDLVAGTGTWSVHGSVPREGRPMRFRSEPTPLVSKRLAGLMEALDPRWHAPSRRLLIHWNDPLRDDDEMGLDNFKRGLEFEEVELEELGLFDTVTVSDVPVGPASAADAKYWAMALVLKRLSVGDRYVAPKAVRAEWDNVVRASPLEGQAGPAPSPTQLASQKGIPARLRWRLNAASDLGME